MGSGTGSSSSSSYSSAFSSSSCAGEGWNGKPRSGSAGFTGPDLKSSGRTKRADWRYVTGTRMERLLTTNASPTGYTTRKTSTSLTSNFMATQEITPETK